MREPSPGAKSPKGSTSSLSNGSVTKNMGFQQQNNTEHLPWSSPAISLPGNCNSNLASESHPTLERSSSNASALTSLCADLSTSDSHFFEVLYIGKVRISQRKVPESLIDDALHKFAQHDLEKAKSQRRHSLMSSSGTSITNNSTETLNDDKKIDSNENINKKLNLSLTSTTPLEPDKNVAWKSAENLAQTTNDNVENNEIDKEFDKFTRERAEDCIIRKPNQVPLEPFVLVLNIPNKNLGTVKEDEEKNEETHSVISESASSITQFCQNIKSTPKTKLRFNDNVSDGHIEKDNSAENNVLVHPFLDNRAVNTDETSSKTKKVQTHKNFDNTEDYRPNESPNTPKTAVINKIDSNEVDSKTTSMPENKPFLRDRSASIGTLNLKTPIAHLIGEQNRTMLFQISRSELRLISPDRKQILLHRAFKDVASCVLGRVNLDHFGFVCRETSEAYACYVFKCESDSVAIEVVNAIKQAFLAHAEFLKKSREKSPNMTCEHCPMLWYHRLCHDVEGMNEKRTHAFILRRIEQLPEEEQELIITKYQGGTNHMYEVSEHNAFLMMLLRAHCEGKQQRHVHDTAENRSEFLNQYLGGSTIFMKAKRSLSSGFDHLLKRRASRDGENLVGVHVKKELAASSLPAAETSSESVSEHLSPELNRSKSLSPAIQTNNNESPSTKTINAITTVDEIEETKDDSSTSPMMDIFLKVSDNRPAETVADNESDATWRQAIYEKVVQPPDGQRDGDLTPNNLLGMKPSYQGKRSKDRLRQLWKMAIDQTILLVRMERENARLKEGEESSAVRRIKLEYSEIGACDAGVTLMWDTLLSRDKSQPMAKVDRHMLTQAVMQGVPRMSRGGVWYFLAEQYCLRTAPPDVKNFPNYHTPYHTLLSGLTKHQHAILIDLGRTFPQHSYFSSSLGPGQLALYNILKGYSMLDPDVGYCQGLSFVAGVLLLHMEEAEAFILLRHLMFRRGLRKQYLPDMSALQVQMYQLSRLLRDHEPDLHAKLEQLDISPALYAAPWMLTLFTSQFPLGFVVRVFDLIFLDSLDVVFSVSLALLSAHKDGLMLCESCEEAAEYLKHKLPDMDKGIYDKVMKKVHTLDISRQLADYAVEYAVLREEMPRLATLTEENRRLISETTRMSDELDSAMEAITKYQSTQSRLESQNKSMEQHLTLLSRYLSAHKQDLPLEIKKIIQNYSKKISFSSKITSFSSKFTSSDDVENDPRKNFKTGMSAPNLFVKISKEDVINAVNREKNKYSPENDKKQFLMKKSQSVHSGLIANNLKHYPLKVLEEQTEKYKRSDSLRTDNLITESLRELNRKNTGYFANTHELIRQERMFEQQQKHVFDENLKKLDEKINPKSLEDDVTMFQSRKSMSLNLKSNTKEQDSKLNDSGFVTPLSPNENEKKDDCISITSHPLSDCDVDIKFDGQSTKLKQIRPIRHINTNSLESKP